MITKTETTETIVYEYSDRHDFIRITVNHFEITVNHFEPGGGSVESNLKRHLTDSDEDKAYSYAVDGLESLLLALACEGFDLSGHNGHIAVQTALETLANKF